MRRDNPVQPHDSAKALWHLFFGTHWYYDYVADYQFVEFSFVREPADPLCWIKKGS
jgi:hypothetical protein